MTKSVFYVLLGESGSGKDFTASIIGYPVVKFAATLKRRLENHYDLPTGALEQRSIKDLRLSHSGDSFLEIMIREYHRQQQKYSELGWREFYQDRRNTNVKDIEFYVGHGLPIMFTDVRNTFEAELIRFLAEANWCKIIIHRLYRSNSKSLSSDKEMDKIFEILKTSEQFHDGRATEDATVEDLRDLYASSVFNP